MLFCPHMVFRIPNKRQPSFSHWVAKRFVPGLAPSGLRRILPRIIKIARSARPRTTGPCWKACRWRTASSSQSCCPEARRRRSMRRTNTRRRLDSKVGRVRARRKARHPPDPRTERRSRSVRSVAFHVWPAPVIPKKAMPCIARVYWSARPCVAFQETARLFEHAPSPAFHLGSPAHCTHSRPRKTSDEKDC